MTPLARNLASIGTALLLAGGAVVLAADSNGAADAPATTASTTPVPATTASPEPATTTATAAPSATPRTTASGGNATSPSSTGPGTSSTGSSSTTGRNSYRERYALLSDRNIFVKDRSRIISLNDRDRPRSDYRSQQRETPRQPPAEASYILTGIVLPEPGEEDARVHAIVEDMKAGKILRLVVGDPVARGQITDMTIDAVQYMADGRQVWVDLGRDFTGAIPASPSAIYAAAAAAAATSTSTTGPTSAPAISGLPLDPNNPNLSIVEKMKIRRMQQMGGQQ